MVAVEVEMVEVVEVFPEEEEEVVVSRNCINEIAFTQIDYQLRIDPCQRKSRWTAINIKHNRL